MHRYPSIAGTKMGPIAITITATLALILIAGGAQAALQSAAASPTSITLTWTAPGDDGNAGTAAQYDIRYSTSLITAQNFTSATQVADEPTPQAAGNAESFDITGLTPATNYYFAIKAADENGNWSAISNVVSAATDNETDAPANITDLTAVFPTENSLMLVWTAPGDDGNVGQAAQYDIRMSTSMITDQNFLSAVQFSNIPTPKIAGQVESLTVAGLDTGMTYYFAIKTADEVPNWSGLSNVATGTTTEDLTPPAAINDLQANTGSESGQIDLSWNAVGDDDMIGSATFYEIRYSLNRITPASWESALLWTPGPTPAPPGQQEELTIYGLQPGQWYWVGTKVYDDAGNVSPMSNVDSAIANFNFGTDIDEDGDGLPDQFALAQNYPNPFNPTTEISFSLPQSAPTNLTIYNVNGQQVATLVDNDLPAGDHVVQWDGRNGSSQAVATGVYFYRLQAGDFNETKKMLMVK